MGSCGEGGIFMPIEFPAVVIGGPPHSGKSVLIYSLTRRLREARIAHYVMRACPDGEGDWANEADQVLVRTLRSKGEYSPRFVDAMVQNIRRRHLPLIVDVGGRPRDWQETLFDECTHGILLVSEQAPDPDAFERDTAFWEELLSRHNLPVIAHLTSNLRGENHIDRVDPILTGTIAGLERGQTADGPTFDVLVAKLADLFSYSETELTVAHVAQAPVEVVLDLNAIADDLGVVDRRWRPEHLPALISQASSQEALAIYGRAPNWVYTCVGLVAETVWLFDVRLGWVAPPVLTLSKSSQGQPDRSLSGWETIVLDRGSFTVLEIRTASQHLELAEIETLPIAVPLERDGLILSGKMPHWLMMSLARQMAPDVKWTAVYQPPLHGAVVVHSKVTDHALGEFIPLDAAYLPDGRSS